MVKRAVNAESLYAFFVADFLRKIPFLDEKATFVLATYAVNRRLIEKREVYCSLAII